MGATKSVVITPVINEKYDDAQWETRYATEEALGQENALTRIRGGLQFDWLQRYGLAKENLPLRNLIREIFPSNSCKQVTRFRKYHCVLFE
jgi:hypothetical protein